MNSVWWKHGGGHLFLGTNNSLWLPHCPICNVIISRGILEDSDVLSCGTGSQNQVTATEDRISPSRLRMTKLILYNVRQTYRGVL